MKLKETFYYPALIWGIKSILKISEMPNPEQEIYCSAMNPSHPKAETDLNWSIVWARTTEGEHYWHGLHNLFSSYFKQECYFDKMIAEYKKASSPQLELDL
jgi:hypothetical protein